MTRLIPLMHAACVQAPCSLEASSLHAVASKMTDVVVRWCLETGCGYGSVHGEWLSDKVHQISQDIAHSVEEIFSTKSPVFVKTH